MDIFRPNHSLHGSVELQVAALSWVFLGSKEFAFAFYREQHKKEPKKSCVWCLFIWMKQHFLASGRSEAFQLIRCILKSFCLLRLINGYWKAGGHGWN